MKRHLAALSILAATAAIVPQQPQGARPFDIRDRTGNMSLTNVSSQSYNVNEDGTVTFRVQGSPVRGEWRDRQTRLNGNRMTVHARRFPDGRMELIDAEATGGSPELLVERPSGGPPGSPNQLFRFASPRVRYQTGNEEITFEGPVRFTGVDEAVQRRWQLDGRSGNAFLHPTGDRAPEFALKSLTLEGPVTFSFRGVRQARGTNGDAREVPTLYQGRANRLVYDDATRTIRLLGNVHLETDDFELAGGVVPVASLTLDSARRNIERVEMSGEPGVVNVRDGASE